MQEKVLQERITDYCTVVGRGLARHRRLGKEPPPTNKPRIEVR